MFPRRNAHRRLRRPAGDRCDEGVEGQATFAALDCQHHIGLRISLSHLARQGAVQQPVGGATGGVQEQLEVDRGPRPKLLVRHAEDTHEVKLVFCSNRWRTHQKSFLRIITLMEKGHGRIPWAGEVSAQPLMRQHRGRLERPCGSGEGGTSHVAKEDAAEPQQPPVRPAPQHGLAGRQVLQQGAAAEGCPRLGPDQHVALLHWRIRHADPGHRHADQTAAPGARQVRQGGLGLLNFCVPILGQQVGDGIKPIFHASRAEGHGRHWLKCLERPKKSPVES
mmetsp:Transcript_79035/g.130676  ORF Transcript_79035/g.130676 Transcript_79035/m.130676 type:complete len:279 (-) Transcript_79035:8-844(-)